MLRNRPLAWLFALILLFGQAAAFAHALTHLRPHESGVPDKVCEVCVAYAQLGAGAPPTPLVLVIPAAHRGASIAVTPLCVDLAPHAACARAPPAPSRAPA